MVSGLVTCAGLFSSVRIYLELWGGSPRCAATVVADAVGMGIVLVWLLPALPVIHQTGKVILNLGALSCAQSLAAVIDMWTGPSQGFLYRLRGVPVATQALLRALPRVTGAAQPPAPWPRWLNLAVCRDFSKRTCERPQLTFVEKLPLEEEGSKQLLRHHLGTQSVPKMAHRRFGFPRSPLRFQGVLYHEVSVPLSDRSAA